MSSSWRPHVVPAGLYQCAKCTYTRTNHSAASKLLFWEMFIKGRSAYLPDANCGFFVLSFFPSLRGCVCKPSRVGGCRGCNLYGDKRSLDSSFQAIYPVILGFEMQRTSNKTSICLMTFEVYLSDLLCQAAYLGSHIMAHTIGGLSIQIAKVLCSQEVVSSGVVIRGT